jgi:hypothetical protein
MNQSGRVKNEDLTRKQMSSVGVRCKSCGSANQHKFIGEMGIRSPGLKNIEKPTVCVFPQLIVCLDCGRAELVVPKNELGELRRLTKGDGIASG